MNPAERVAYGRTLQALLSDPSPGIASPEDLSFCSSRVLLLRQFAVGSSQALAPLIDETMQALAGLRAEAAWRGVLHQEPIWGQSPIFCSLLNHVLAQCLTEFALDLPEDLRRDMARGMADRMRAFRVKFEAAPPHGDAALVALECHMGHAAIFREIQAFDWACATLGNQLGAIAGTRDDIAIGAAALLGGATSAQGHDSTQSAVAAWLESAGARDAYMALTGRELIVAPEAGEPERAPLSGVYATGSLAASSGLAPVADKIVVKKKPRKEKKDGIIASTLETYAWLVGPVVVLGIIALAILAIGKGYDWFENNTNVGQQSLSQFYSRMNDKHAAEKGDAPAEGADPTPAPEEPSATPAPVAVATQPPAPDDAARLALQGFAQEGAGRVQDRIAVARSTTFMRVPGAPADVVTTRGGYLRYETQPQGGTPPGAHVLYHVNWFEDDALVGEQWIHAVAEWDGAAWQWRSAARCINRKDGQGRLIYVATPEEKAWALALLAP